MNVSDIKLRAKSLGHHLKDRWRVSQFGTRIIKAATCTRCGLNIVVDSKRGISGGLLGERCDESEEKSQESETGSTGEAAKDSMESVDESKGKANSGRDG